MFQAEAEIVENREVGPGYYKLILYSPEITGKSAPGQFLQIRCNQNYSPLLRRPFSIHRILETSSLEILYKKVGKGTELLRQKKPKEKLDILGPLGNGFKIPEGLKSALLVAGGMGVAPLLALAEELRRKEGKVHLLIGAKRKDSLLCEKEFKDLGCQMKLSTEDGSAGFKGTVTALLADFLSTGDHRPSTIYACGPRGMLKEVSGIAKEEGLSCQVSLEEYMACGVGACLGCPVKTKSGYKMVCKEGPVFSGQEVVW
jgi:dihydroorotate dehydrogenase electron transfer subunit